MATSAEPANCTPPLETTCSPTPRSHLGLDLAAFLASFDRCLAEVAASEDNFPDIELNPELLPEIHLDPPYPAMPSAHGSEA